MKIAVAAEGALLTAHFGHCENFLIYTVKENKIVDKTIVANPGHRPGFLPNFLHNLGVNVIISGGMGSAAVQIFNSHDIEVIVGCSGEANKTVREYLAGSLKHTGEVCHAHSHN